MPPVEYTRPFFPRYCNQDSTQLIVFDTRGVGKIWLGLARATKKKPSRKRKASLEKNADTLRCSISTTLFCKSVNTFTKTYSSTTTIKMHPPSNARKCNKMTFNMRDASHAEQFMSKFFKLHFKFSSLIHSTFQFKFKFSIITQLAIMICLMLLFFSTFAISSFV